jgi:DNA-binding transcriptional LysR family regulator
MSARLFGPLNCYAALAAPLTQPTLRIATLNHLSRRARLTDDVVRRTLGRLSEAVGGDPLIASKDRCLALTQRGLDLYRAAIQLIAVTQGGQAESESVELLRIAVSPGIDPRLLAIAAGQFFEVYHGMLALQFETLDPQTIAESIRSGAIAFAIVWDGDQLTPGGKRLEPGLRWSVLAPFTGHPLSDFSEPVTAERLAGCRVFLPPKAGAAADLQILLSQVSPANRVQVDSRFTARAMAASGLGVAFDLGFVGAEHDGCGQHRRLPVEGLAEEHLCLYGPRQQADLAEPAGFLFAAFQEAARELTLPKLPLPELLVEEIPLPEPLPA